LNPDPEKHQTRRIYLDTSAYLCLLLAQDGSDRLIKETKNARLLSSVLLVVEARRNLVRLAREGRLKPDQYKSCIDRLEHDMRFFSLRDVTLDLCQSNVMPAVAIPRSLDLIHLRTAVWFDSSERIDRFLTMDVSQEEAARELGLSV
jgi:predicted nucleic acid-binding protein